MSNDESVDIEKQFKEQAAMNQQLKQQLALIESVAKQKMSKEAISRYGNLKLAHPEIAVKAIAFIAQAASAGQINEKISDDDFKLILKSIQEGKKEFKFKK
jgi:DNA-binding TFAR19-related protein (PDSD5 family)